MAVLTTKNRNALPTKDFAGPDRSYPVNDASHARNALSRVSQYGTPEEKAEVRAKVASKYPNIGMAKARAKALKSGAEAEATKRGGYSSKHGIGS